MRQSTRALAVIVCWAWYVLGAGSAFASPSTIVFITSTSDIGMDYELQKTFQSRWREREPHALILPYSLTPYAFPLTAKANELAIATIDERLKGKSPTLIVAQGDPGFFFALALRDTRFPSAPLVAFDVVGSEERKKRFENEKSVYVVELSEIGEKNVELAMRLFPKRKRLVLLLHVGKDLQRVSAIHDRYVAHFPDLRVVTVPNPSQDSADAVLREDPEDTFVIGLSPGWMDSSGRYRSGKDYVRSIMDTYHVPMFEYLRSHLDEGTVGGVGMLPSRWGRDAADRGLALIFDGIEGEHWIKGAEFTNAFADYREIRRFGSSPDLLPPGTELINTPAPAWIRYERVFQFLFAFLVLAVTIMVVRSIFRHREKVLLIEANARLEREVLERTGELRRVNEDLASSNAGLTEAIRRTEEMQENVLRSARAITLGRFTSGMANGLNSPLNAMHSASASLRLAACRDEDGLVSRVLEFDDGQRALFLRYAKRVLTESDHMGEVRKPSSSELERRLQELCADDVSSIASDLSEAGLSDLTGPELSAFIDEKGRAVAEALYRLSVLDRSTWIIDEAVGRASEIIEAVREYVAESNADAEPIPVDLRGTVERALFLFKNRLPSSVTLRTDYGEVPPVLGVETTFVRVWASLLQNALQAMPGGGTLDVTLKTEEGKAVVSIADEGEGIDPSIAEKIFDPFVTTRSVAEGIGLGLAFCKRALESVGGEIGFTSRERGTIFYVRIPLGGAA